VAILLPLASAPQSQAVSEFDLILRQLTSVQPDAEYRIAVRYVQWLMLQAFVVRRQNFTSVALTFPPGDARVPPDLFMVKLVQLVEMYEAGKGLYALHDALCAAQCSLRLSAAWHVDGFYMPAEGAWTMWFARPEDLKARQVSELLLPARTEVWEATSHLHQPGRSLV
jgi:hypothetical protein